MATVYEITTGTTGPSQSTIRIEIVSADRKVSGFVSFINESAAQRAQFRLDEQPTEEEKAAALDWLRGLLDERWPGKLFLDPPDFFVMAQKKNARSVLTPGKLPPA